MNKPLLSILIPYTPDRNLDVKNLIVGIIVKNDDWPHTEQLLKIGEVGSVTVGLENGIEVILMCDNKEMTIGEKRELLYKEANGLYSWQVDSDDEIASNAIELILQAIKENPDVDCITFREKCIMNGEYRSCNHSLKYDWWQDNFDGYSYVRTPFYKDVIKTEIAKSVPIPHIRFNEDEQWSMALKPHLKTEHHIDEELYYYLYNETNHNERYGIES